MIRKSIKLYWSSYDNTERDKEVYFLSLQLFIMTQILYV